MAVRRTESGSSAMSFLVRRQATVRPAPAVRRELARPPLSTDEALTQYPPSECLLDEMVQCLGGDSVWRKRRMMLHRDTVLFIDTGMEVVVDMFSTMDVDGCERCEALDKEHDDERAFKIVVADGRGSESTVVVCRSRGLAGAKIWVEKIADITKARPTCLERYQAQARRLERHSAFSLCAACLIMANFALICAEAQVRADSASVKTFGIIDTCFTAAFTLELFIIMSGQLPYAFWKERWNLFDFFIVTTSLVQLIFSDLLEMQQFRLLRMFRVVRVLRVFGKLQQLRHIIDSIAKSIVPVLDAIFICLMVVMMFATIGVDAWREEAPEDFGDFFRAIWALFSVLTFEDWPSLLHPFPESGKVRYDVVLYVYAYVGIINYILLQVWHACKTCTTPVTCRCTCSARARARAVSWVLDEHQYTRTF